MWLLGRDRILERSFPPPFSSPGLLPAYFAGALRSLSTSRTGWSGTGSEAAAAPFNAATRPPSLSLCSGEEPPLGTGVGQAGSLTAGPGVQSTVPSRFTALCCLNAFCPNPKRLQGRTDGKPGNGRNAPGRGNRPEDGAERPSTRGPGRLPTRPRMTRPSHVRGLWGLFNKLISDRSHEGVLRVAPNNSSVCAGGAGLE